MKIYTKTGDKGYTSLTGGKRIKKNDPIVEAYGSIDEANSMIGLAISLINNDEKLEAVKAMLIEVQRDLFHAGAEISTPEGSEVYWPLAENQINNLEAYIDELEKDLPALKSFILPGGTQSAATLHVARAMIRRAERNALSQENEVVMAYLNRCSDFLFVAARSINYLSGQNDINFTPKQV